jgi:hypothetical protein
MKRPVKIKGFFIFLVCYIAHISALFGQSTFTYQAEIEPVKKSGFYKIQLQPRLIAKGKNDLSDLRIIDQKNKYLAYAKVQSSISQEEDFTPFEILSLTSQDSVTTMILKNENRLLLTSLWLNFKNAAVFRRADVLGSDDQKDWFAIQEDILLSTSSITRTDNFLQSLSFPANRYMYFKVKIYNGKKEALQIIRAGIFRDRQRTLAYTAIPSPIVSQIDSANGSSYLKMAFKENFLINKLTFKVSKPKFYRRQVLVFSKEGKQKRLIGEAIFRSDGKAEMHMNTRTHALEVQVINGDNPPLTIGQVLAAQATEYVLAYLEEGEQYKFLIGDRKAAKPQYDMEYFADSIQNVTEISHNRLLKNALYKAQINADKTDYTILLWAAILSVLSLLIYFSWKMLTEINRS